MKHLTSWISLTGSPEDYSVGLSVEPYTTQWGLALFDATVAGYADFAYFSPEISGTEPRLTISVAPGYDEMVMARFVGCVFIGMMPEKGLPEVLESLSDMWHFYRDEPLKLQVSHSPIQKVKGSIADHKKRPDMVISQ